MHTGAFIKGIGLGVLAGAALTAAVVPIDRKRMKHSAPGRAIKAVERMMG